MTALTRPETVFAYTVMDRLDAKAEADMEAATTTSERDVIRHRAAWWKRIRQHLGEGT